MSAYLMTLISGNESFGGYLSVDGEKAFAVKHDMTYELSPGPHCLVIYSTSNFQRSAGKVQAFAYNHSSSSGAILDTLERNSTLKNLGDGWQIDVMVGDGELLELNILSKGQKIVGDPMYSVRELEGEEIAALEKKFEEWRNTPVRSTKQMAIGVILAIVGIAGISNIASGNEDIGGENPAAVIAVMAGLIVVGGLLVFLGSKKKLRRK